MSRGGLDRRKSRLSGDIVASALINEELSDSMSFYYEKSETTTSYSVKGFYSSNLS